MAGSAEPCGRTPGWTRSPASATTPGVARSLAISASSIWVSALRRLARHSAHSLFDLSPEILADAWQQCALQAIPCRTQERLRLRIVHAAELDEMRVRQRS